MMIREYPFQVEFHQHWVIIDTRTGKTIRDFGNHASAALACYQLNDEHNK